MTIRLEEGLDEEGLKSPNLEEPTCPKLRITAGWDIGEWNRKRKRNRNNKKSAKTKMARLWCRVGLLKARVTKCELQKLWVKF